MPPEKSRLHHGLAEIDGWLELKNWKAAHEAWESLPTKIKASSAGIERWCQLCQDGGNWPMAAEAAFHLSQMEPGDARWPLLQGYCLAEADLVKEALAVVERAGPLFPEDALYPYNAACYFCRLGKLGLAQERLALAFTLDPELEASALEDPDLQPLR